MKIFRKIISLTLITAFIGSSLYVPKAQAGEMVVPIIPKPGTMVNLSPDYTPAYLKGIVIHPDNALKFDFLVHKGDGNLDDSQKRQEYKKLIKYFLAALTVPDKDQWVNLSPYEKNRIVEDDFGATEMGRDLLSQDYLLKQITSSLMYPESGLGKVFWDKVYERAYKEYGTTDIPVNTFNKVWIVPDEALIYESGNTAYVVKSHLKVMLEEDYLSLKKHTAIENPDPKQNALHSVSSKIIKEVILPEIEREVNTAKNFAMLRQVFSGMVLATWYKKALKESLLGEVYADKAKVLGIDQNPKNNQAIYQKYLAAFKKGVYNYIKEDTDKYTNEIIPRKYFAGGFVRRKGDVRTVHVPNAAMVGVIESDQTVDAATVAIDQAQASDDNVKSAKEYILDAARKLVREQDWSKLEALARLWGEQAEDHGEFFQITFSRSLLGAKEWLKSKINEIIPGAIIDFEENGTPGNIQTVVKIQYPDAAMGSKRPRVSSRDEQRLLRIAELRGRRDIMDRKLQEDPNNQRLIKQRLELVRRIDQLMKDRAMVAPVGSQSVNSMTPGQFIDQLRDTADKNYRIYLTQAGIKVAEEFGLLMKVDQNSGDRYIVGKSAGSLSRNELLINFIFAEGQDTMGRVTGKVIGLHKKRDIKLITTEPDVMLHPPNLPGYTRRPSPVDSAMTKGGIDLNAANLAMVIKRDGRGVPLPVSQQDMAQLSRIQGFVPRILEIKPVSSLPFLSDDK